MRQLTTDECHDYINILRSQNKNTDEIKADLSAKGLSDAEIAVAFQGSDDKQHITNKRNAKAAMVLGIGFILIGFAIPAITYAIAVQNGGGHYMIFYWPIIFGIITFVGGFNKYRKALTVKSSNPAILDDGI